MTFKTELRDCIKRIDYVSFLLCYIKLIKQNFNLAIPHSLNKDIAIDEWRNILLSISENFTEDFLNDLTSHWLEVIQKQGGVINENFINEILSILEQRSGEIVDADSKKMEEKKLLTEDEMPKPGLGLIDSVKGTVSNTYYNKKKNREVTIREENELPRKILTALEHENIDDFLIYYLSYAEFGKLPEVPLVSTIAGISIKWKIILSKEFAYNPSDIFLEKLTSKWFYLVNAKGIPITSKIFYKLLEYCISTRPHTSETAEPERKNNNKAEKKINTKIKNTLSNLFTSFKKK